MEAPGDQPRTCGRRPVLYRLRAGHGGRVLAELCGICAEEQRRQIAAWKSEGLKMDPELVLEEIETTTEEAS